MVCEGDRIQSNFPVTLFQTLALKILAGESILKEDVSLWRRKRPKELKPASRIGVHVPKFLSAKYRN